MRVVVVGPGAIGGTIAAALMESGQHEVVICARQKFDKLTITRADSGEIQSYPAYVEVNERDVWPGVWVILAVKSHQTEASANWLKQVVSVSSGLAVLQNGVEHRERVQPFIPQQTDVVPVVVQLPAQRRAPGEITTYGKANLIVEDNQAGREFAGLFADTPVKVNLTDDFMTRQWEKLCLNAASGSISTLTLNPDAIGTTPGLRELALALVEECMAVGRAEGARFSDNYAMQLVDGFMMRTGNRGNSMYYDRRDGNVLEFDARNTVIQRLGRKHGIATPISDVIVPLLRGVGGKNGR